MGFILRERNVAEQSLPIKLDGLGGAPRARNARRGRADEKVGIRAFDVEGEPRLRIRERRRSAQGYSFKIGRIAARKRGKQGLIGF